jgi:hypothetical protein
MLHISKIFIELAQFTVSSKMYLIVFEMFRFLCNHFIKESQITWNVLYVRHAVSAHNRIDIVLIVQRV